MDQLKKKGVKKNNTKKIIFVAELASLVDALIYFGEINNPAAQPASEIFNQLI